MPFIRSALTLAILVLVTKTGAVFAPPWVQLPTDATWLQKQLPGCQSYFNVARKEFTTFDDTLAPLWKTCCASFATSQQSPCINAVTSRESELAVYVYTRNYFIEQAALAGVK
jgi:hypothetical protein